MAEAPTEDATMTAGDNNTDAVFDGNQHTGRAPTEDASPTADNDTFVVSDGNQDIAMNADLERMMVQAPGRRHFQRTFLWNGSRENGKTNDRSSGFTNLSYKPDEHSPKLHPVGRLPTRTELESGEEAIEYIEVGIVCGENPAQYKQTGPSGPAKVKARLARGDMQRDPYALRAFTPITEKVKNSNKYYVGVMPTAGRLIPRTTTDEVIFFYPEFYNGVDETANKVERKLYVNKQVRRYAANSVETAERSTAAIVTVGDMEKWNTANPLVVSPPETLANTMVILSTLFAETRDRSYIRNIIAQMDRANPDLVFGPHASSQGVVNFYAFDGIPFTPEDASAVVRELKVAAPTMPDLSASVVRAAHRALMSDEVMRHRLPYADLGFFFTTCTILFPSSFEEMDDQTLAHHVEKVLSVVEGHGIYKTYPTASNVAVEPLSEKNFRLTISAIKDIVDQLIIFDKNYSQQVAEQHGGVTRHAGMNDIINKIANAIDVVTQQANFEQIANIHAVQFAFGSSRIAGKLSELSALLVKVLNVGKGQS